MGYEVKNGQEIRTVETGLLDQKKERHQSALGLMAECLQGRLTTVPRKPIIKVNGESILKLTTMIGLEILIFKTNILQSKVLLLTGRF